jgi:hypothetical protein
VNCYVTFFSRRSSDPAMRAVQESRQRNKGEPFYWHEWKEGVRPHPILGKAKMIGGFVPSDIEQMGETGVVARLDKGNMWSGRGEFSSLEEAAAAQQAANDKKVDDQRKKLRDGLEGPLRATIRHARGLPQVSVPDNLTPE